MRKNRFRKVLRLLSLLAFGLFSVFLSIEAAAGSIFTTQLGFAPSDPKVAVLAVPAGTTVALSFRVLELTTDSLVYTSQPADMLFYPNGWVANNALGDAYLLDFTRADLAAGRYVVESNGLRSFPFNVGSNIYDVRRVNPLDFFRIQLSGVSGSWQSLDGSVGGHTEDHLDDARQANRKDRGGGDRALIQQDLLPLPNGRLNVSGGWFDAGDYNKYMGNTPWAAYLLLLTYEEYGAYWSQVDENRNGEPDLIEYVKPALEWMLKMQHTDGSVYERVFNGFAAAFDGRPDLETDNQIGTADDRPLDTDRYADITVKSSYTMAVAFRVFGDPRYLDMAIRTWDWALNNQSKVKPKVYGGGLYFGDVEIGLTLGALELYRATTDPKYLNYAAARVQNHLDLGDWVNPSSWDFQQAYALIRYFDLAAAADKARILSELGGRWDAGAQSQGRNAYRMNDEWLYGNYGQNENSTSSAGDALWVFDKTNDRKYYDYAVNQMAWIFGRNPFGESWLASAEVSEYTRVPHWRATARHPIEGVVVPGATDRDANGVPDYTDTGDWFYSEPAINQQAMFIRVMTALYFASGVVVSPPADSPPSVSIINPADGATVSGAVTVEANAGDDFGVTGVAYRIDDGAEAGMALVSGDASSGAWRAGVDTALLADGQHKLTVVATDTGGQKSSPFVMINVNNGASPTFHVERIDVTLNAKGGNKIQAKGDVYIYDAFGRAVTGASVGGHWESAATDAFNITTDAAGKATDYSNLTARISGITFTFVVDHVALPGWLYDPKANKQTRASVTVP